MKKLTKSEEEIMLVLWKLGEATIRDIMGGLDQQETPYTTISTVVRVLEKKGFVGHTAIGTTYIYRPLVRKREYLRGFLSGIVTSYFDGSFSRMAAFFARENDLDLSELKEVISDIEDELKKEGKNE
ncbi:MAG: BlaI/MecI/CopY family transcriptional regulator [Bacteroidetes bacterium]|nr:MAG: BlaI/MecI/CopY family transcriptional regulator [Bacteroidota bacterium]